MNRAQMVAIGAVFMAIWIGLEAGYKIGHHAGSDAGYSQGWSDAHCGPNNSCEAGEE